MKKILLTAGLAALANLGVASTQNATVLDAEARAALQNALGESATTALEARFLDGRTLNGYEVMGHESTGTNRQLWVDSLNTAKTVAALAWALDPAKLKLPATRIGWGLSIDSDKSGLGQFASLTPKQRVASERVKFGVSVPQGLRFNDSLTTFTWIPPMDTDRAGYRARLQTLAADPKFAGNLTVFVGGHGLTLQRFTEDDLYWNMPTAPTEISFRLKP
ncbi:MAG: hypothetical protein K0S08_2158 [Gammaproteobacteria bacterium]|jgi:hypothetical protein|nr:hypothetical protein [Gammaproteobacteria bacterium]